MQQLGAELERGAQELFQAAKTEEERVNHLRAEEAYTKLREKQLDLTMGEQNGFANLKGSAAVTRPVLSEWSKRFTDAQAEVAGTLSNDEQRTRFRARSDVARLQYTEDIYRHLARENDTYAKEVFEGTLGVEQRSAVAKWDSPNDIAASLERIKQAVGERAARYSWPAEYTKSVLQQENGKVHNAVVLQAVAKGQWRYGRAWYEQHRDDIDLQTARILERTVEEATQKELQAQYNANYLASENSRKTLEGLRKQVLGDQELHEDRRNVLVGRIQNRISVLEHRAEMAEARRVRQVQHGLNELNGSTLAGFEPSQQQFDSLISAARGTELEPAVRQAIGLANTTREFRNSTLLRQEQILTSAEAGIRTDPTKFDRRVVSAWRQIHESQRKQIEESPISFAVRQGLVEAPQPLDLSKPEAAGPALVERFAIARGVQRRYGQADMKPLTENEARIIPSVLKQMPVAQKSEYFAQLFKASGGDMQGYSAIMAQIAKDDPVTAAAGDFAAKGRTEAARLMLGGLPLIRPNRAEDGKPGDHSKLWPMPAEKDLERLFRSYEGNAFAGHAGLRNQVWQSALTIYARKSADEGDASAIPNPDRWKESMRLASGGIESWNGHRIVMPYGYTMGQFKDALSQRIDDIVASGKVNPIMTSDRLRSLRLEPVGDGRYQFVSGNSILYEKDGKRPVTVDLYHFSARYLPPRKDPDEFEPSTGTPLGDAVRRHWPKQLRRIDDPLPLSELELRPREAQ